MVTTQRGKPVAMLRSLENDSHVKTRISQYQALENGKGIEIAKRIIYGKIEGQNQVLNKYGLMRHDLVKAKVALPESSRGDGPYAFINSLGFTAIVFLNSKQIQNYSYHQ